MKVPDFFSLFLWLKPPSRTDPSITEIWGITDRLSGPLVIFTPADNGKRHLKRKRRRRRRRRRKNRMRRRTRNRRMT